LADNILVWFLYYKLKDRLLLVLDTEKTIDIAAYVAA